jgi:hypothetical protein
MASTITVEFIGDTRKLQQAFGQVESSTDSMGRKMGDAGKFMTTGITLPILAAGGAAIKLSSDIGEMEDRTKDVFTNASGQVIAWSDTLLEKFGIGKDEALDFANVQGNAMLAAGISQQNVLKIQDQAIKRIGDLSSATNASSGEIVEAYASMQRGEYDPMERFVPGISAATVAEKAMAMGLAETTEELDNQDKLQAAHALFLENSANAAGNFARTQGGAANQSRLLQENVEKLGREFGENLLPVTQDVLKTANGMLENWEDLTEGQQDLILKTGGLVAALGPVLVVSGKVVGSASDMAKGYKALRTSMDTGAISKLVTALGGPGGLVAVAAPVAAGLGVIALAAKGTADDLRSTATAAEAVVDPLLGVETNARNLYRIISENKGLTLADIAGPESEQRLKRLRDQLLRLMDTSPQLAKELLDLAEAEGDVSISATGMAEGHTSGRNELILTKEEAALLARRVKDLGQTEAEAGNQARDAAGDTKALGGQMEDTAGEAQTLREKIDKLYDATIDASRAGLDYEEQLDDLRKSLRDNGTSLDGNTEKGRTNRRAVIDLIEKVQDHIGALEDDGATMGKMRRVFDNHQEDFRKTMRAAGFTKDEIKDLERQYGLVPGKVLTDVGVRGKRQAVQDAKDIRGALAGIGESIASIRGRFHVSVGGSGGITQATGDIWSWLPERDARGMSPKIMQVPHRIGGEAGAESYIPLANDERRPRAIELLRETNRRLGDPLLDMAFARGGFYENLWARPSLEDIQIKKLLGGPALAWARSQAGKPYGWGGVGPGSYDCSGFMSAIHNVLLGRYPHQRLYATGSIRAGIAGLKSGLGGRFQIGSVTGSPGHMAGTLFGVNVESSGSVGVRVGGGARGATNSLFRQHFHLRRGGLVESLHGDAPFDVIPQGDLGEVMPAIHLPAGRYDDGRGSLPTGLSLAYNGTGRPEPVGHTPPVVVNVFVEMDGERFDKRIDVRMDHRDQADLVHAQQGIGRR